MRVRPERDVGVTIQLRTNQAHRTIRAYVKNFFESDLGIVQQVQCNDMGLDKPAASGKKRAK